MNYCKGKRLEKNRTNDRKKKGKKKRKKKMERRLIILEGYLPWLFLLLCIDGVFILVLWLADLDAFHALAAVLILGTCLFFGILCNYLAGREKKRQQAFLDFLNNPDEYHEELLHHLLNSAEKEMIGLLGKQLRSQEVSYQQVIAHISDYEEYVEAWAHETKEPISLLALLLDNRREELPGHVGCKLDYIRNRMQEYVSQMLFYARLKAAHRDYLFEFVDLQVCVEDSLEEYQSLLEEKGFQIIMEISDAHVYTDRRGIGFIMNQVVSNAVKYSSPERIPELLIRFRQGEGSRQLSVKDNGIGVRENDLPYIFEKGFTGNVTRNREKATGMGLYLADKIAYDLKLSLQVQSVFGEGFEITIVFPEI